MVTNPALPPTPTPEQQYGNRPALPPTTDTAAPDFTQAQANINVANQDLEMLKQSIGYGQYQDSALAQANLRAQEVAQNQFSQNQGQAQLTALDAIRRANASMIASGANQGLAAAQQLQATLGMQQQATADATKLANQYMATEAESQQKITDQMNQALQVGGTLTAAEAEIAKGAAAARETEVSATRAAEEARTNAAIDLQTQRNTALENMAKFGSNTPAGQTYQAIANKQAWALEGATAEEIRQRQQQIAPEVAKMQAHANVQSLTAGLVSGDNFVEVTYWLNPETMQREKIGIWGTATRKRADDTQTQRDKILKASQDFQKKVESGEKTQAEYDRWVAGLEISQASPCITEDTLITMSDGSQKQIKDIKPGEQVRSYDPRKGTVITTLFTPLKHPACEHDVLRLHFSTGLIDTAGGHSFCLDKPRKCVVIDIKSVMKYIGKRFLIAPGKYATLDTYEIYEDNRPLYSPMASKYIWLYTNNILSAAHLTEFIVNARLRNPMPRKTICYKQVPEKLREQVPEFLFDAYDGEMLPYWARGFKKFTIGKHIRKLIKLLDV